MPVRIYAFAKELGFDNKQLLDICDSAGIEDKGSALASLSDEEVIAIKDYLASPPPPVEETFEPEEEFEADEAEEAADDGSAGVAETAEVVDEDPPTADPPEAEATDDEAPADDEKPSKSKSVVSGLLGKLRSRSKEVMPSVKATMGKPIVKKASIHDVVAKGKGGAATAPQPQEKITPSTSKTPTRNPLFNRGPKVVRDLDSRPQKSEAGEEKKRPVTVSYTHLTLPTKA